MGRGATLYQRDAVLTVGTRRIATRSEVEGSDRAAPTLRFAFKVERTASREPNKARVAIWNLSADSRAALQGESQIDVEIEAGYTSNLGLLFRGQLQTSTSKREGVDWVTELESADGARAYRSARINDSIRSGAAQLSQVLERVANASGLGLGNALDKIREGDFRGGITELSKGVVLSGKVSDVLDKVLTTAGFTWSIQDGELQLLRPGEVSADEAILLTYGSGLIGSPEAGERGIVSVRTLLQPQIKPGRKLEIVSSELDGYYAAQKVVHSGDSFGTDWYTDVEARPL